MRRFAGAVDVVWLDLDRMARNPREKAAGIGAFGE